MYLGSDTVYMSFQGLKIKTQLLFLNDFLVMQAVLCLWWVGIKLESGHQKTWDLDLFHSMTMTLSYHISTDRFKKNLPSANSLFSAWIASLAPRIIHVCFKFYFRLPRNVYK